MKFTAIIGTEHDEEVVIYAHKKTEFVTQIENLISENALELVGYKDKNAVRLNLSDVYCFSVEDSKVYAVLHNEKLQLKYRLYQLEEKLPQNFIKINQSCIANIKKIERFDASISGALRVCFKNGCSDYVSRRRMKDIKERLGL